METGDLLEILLNRLCSEKENHVSFRLMRQIGFFDERLVPQLKKNLLQRRKGTCNNIEYNFSTFIKERLLRKDERVILLKGSGGIGKTVTLLTMATDLIATKLNTPCVYIPLNAFNTFTLTDSSDYIKQYLRNTFDDSIADELALRAGKQWDKYPQLVLLLDGENEIVNTKIKEIENNIEEWALKQGVFIVVTTRLGISRIMNRTEFEFAHLSKESARYYLKKAFDPNIDRLPKPSDPIYEVLDTPLMLNLYIQTSEYARIYADYPYALWRKPVNSGHLIWNYLQKDICKCAKELTVKEKILNTAEYVFLLICIAPFVCYCMEEKGQYYIDDPTLLEGIKQAISFYGNCTSLPQQIESVQNYENEYIDFSVNKNQLRKYKYALTDTLALFHDTNNPLGMNRQYELLHQNFRDGLAAIHLNNLMELDTAALLNEMTKHKTEYILECLGDLSDKSDLLRMWDNHRSVGMNHTVTENILQIYGKRNNWNYTDLNWSNMDLTKLNFVDYRDPKTGKLLVSINAEDFNGTQISLSSFKAIGHRFLVNRIYCVQGSNRIISVDFERKAIVWDSLTLKPLGNPLNLAGCNIHTILFTSSGEKMILGDYNGNIQVWDIESQTLVGISQKGHEGNVSCIDINYNETLIVSGSDDGTLCLWAFDNLEKIGPTLKSHTGGIECVSFNPEGTRLVSGSVDATVRIWTINEIIGQRNPIIKKIDGLATSIQWIGNDKFLIKLHSGNGDSVEIWEITDNNFYLQYRKMPPVRTIELLSVNGNPVIVEVNDHSLSFINGHTCQSLNKELIVEPGEILDVIIDESASFIAIAMQDKSISIWNYDTQKHLFTVHLPTDFLILQMQFASKGKTILVQGVFEVYIIRIELKQKALQPKRFYQSWFAPICCTDYTKAILSTTDCMIRLWDIKNNTSYGNMIPMKNTLLKIFAFNKKSTQFACASDRGEITVFDVDSQKPLISRKVANLRINSMCFDYKDEQIIFSSGNELFAWNLIEPDKICRIEYKLKDNSSSLVSFPNENRLLVGGYGFFDVIDLDNPDYSQTFFGRVHGSKSVVFLEDGKKLVYESVLSKLSILNFGESVQIREFKSGSQQPMSSIAISKDSKKLVTGYRDKTILLWDIDNLTQIGQPIICDDDISTVSFSDDGEEIVVFTINQTIQKWSVQKNEKVGETVYPLMNIDLNGLDFTKANILDETDKMIFKQNGVKVQL